MSDKGSRSVRVNLLNIFFIILTHYIASGSNKRKIWVSGRVSLRPNPASVSLLSSKSVNFCTSQYDLRIEPQRDSGIKRDRFRMVSVEVPPPPVLH